MVEVVLSHWTLTLKAECARVRVCMCVCVCVVNTLIQALFNVTENYKTGCFNEEETYADLAVAIYNNEHLFPDVRRLFPDALPPKPYQPPGLARPAPVQQGMQGSGQAKSRARAEQEAPVGATTLGPSEQAKPAASTQGTASTSEASGHPAEPSTQPTPLLHHTLSSQPASQHTTHHTTHHTSPPPAPSRPTPPIPVPSHPTPVSHTTPAATHAPDSPCTTVQRLTEADLARISDLARDAWADASRDRRPMLWHVRRRAYERACARLGLPAAGVQSLLWVASERGDAWGSLDALRDADPGGLCLPPELRRPLHVWSYLSWLTGSIVFYVLGDGAVLAAVFESLRQVTIQLRCS